MSKALMRIPLDKAKQIPLCINCKYYISPSYKNKKLGFCQKSGTVHVVDGTIEYENVEIYREYTCKGKLYEEINHALTAVESVDFISY